jgi:hypothetical protein
MGMEYQANFKNPMSEAAVNDVCDAVLGWPNAKCRKSSTSRLLEMDCVPKQTPTEWTDFDVHLSTENCHVIFHLKVETSFLKYLEEDVFPRCGE